MTNSLIEKNDNCMKGCQMAYYQTPQKFRLIMKGIAIENFGIFYGHLVCFWLILQLHRENSGNPVVDER
jgi:hypothetical protein